MLADRALVMPGSVQQDTGIHPAEWAANVGKKKIYLLEPLRSYTTDSTTPKK